MKQCRQRTFFGKVWKLILILLLCAGPSLAAKRNVDVVHLKDGTIVKGTIIEQIPSESLKIQKADGTILIFQMDDVRKITQETGGVVCISINFGQMMTPKSRGW